MASPVINVTDSESNVEKNLCDLVLEKAEAAIKERGIFVIGVSGGSAAKFLCNGLPLANTDWGKWRIFFCDERYVNHDDPECTYKYYKNNLVSKVQGLSDNIFPVNPDIQVESAAEEYLKILRQVFPGEGVPRFDLLVLGMGPDGHTCSLFPGHPLTKEMTRLVAPITDSPKPPPTRVTLTFPVINNAACAVFAAAGAGKADMVQKVLDGDKENPLPAAMVRPTNGEVIWFLDSAAASKLKTTTSL
ncbi:6-phosphogluconolactonase-like [Babylonia areolata]|uniref:6-phosphogluconolactonase-like n=1 Tax=Babylonia areolata TaxID=304850 RepID=UPI003FCEF3AE